MFECLLDWPNSIVGHSCIQGRKRAAIEFVQNKYCSYSVASLIQARNAPISTKIRSHVQFMMLIAELFFVVHDMTKCHGPPVP